MVSKYFIDREYNTELSIRVPIRGFGCVGPIGQVFSAEKMTVTREISIGHASATLLNSAKPVEFVCFLTNQSATFRLRSWRWEKVKLTEAEVGD